MTCSDDFIPFVISASFGMSTICFFKDHATIKWSNISREENDGSLIHLYQKTNLHN